MLPINLLGPPIIRPMRTAKRPLRPQSILLLAYLATHPQPATRSQLADLFWPRKTEQQGRRNLSWAINNVRGFLPDALRVQGETIAFGNVESDVGRFEQLVKSADFYALQQAVALVRGEFLAGVETGDAYELESWLERERDHWEQRVQMVRERLTQRQRTPRPVVRDTRPLFGRSAEIIEIADKLRGDNVRLLTLVGIGGVGKTRLAHAVGDVLQAAFVNGVVFVPLEGISAETLPAAILHALAQPATQNPTDQLHDFLHDKDVLLVLDNFEHLITTVDQLSTLLHAAPHLKLLVTSREPLRIRAEHLHTVQSLAVPSASATMHDNTSVQLLVERASRNPLGFRLRDGNRAAVLQICQQVAGLPLALELAASALVAYPPDALAKQLTDSLAPLQTDLRDVPQRHRSLDALFVASWTGLSDDERELLTTLTLFQPDCDHRALAKITPHTVHTLPSLLRKSLVTRSDDRYHLHPVLRQFSAAHAESLPHEQHARFYLDWFATQVEPLEAGDGVAVQARFGNIRVAWKWAVQHAPTLLCAAVHPLYLYFENFAPLPTGEQLLRHAEQATSGALHGRVCVRRAGLLMRLGQLEGVEMALQDGVAALAAATFDSRTDLALGYKLLGSLTYYRGEFVTALAHYERSLAQWRALDNQREVARCLNNIGNTLHHPPLQNLDAAQQYLEESLALCRKLGDRRGMGVCYRNLGALAILQGDRQRADALMRHCLALLEEVGYQSAIASVLVGLVENTLAMGAWESAEKEIQQGLATARENGNRDYEINFVSLRGLLRMRLDRSGYADLHAAIEDANQLGNQPLLLNCLLNLALGSDMETEVGRRLAAYLHTHSAQLDAQKQAQVDLLPNGEGEPPQLAEVLRLMINQQ